jgi:hypothetical protein
VNHGVKKNRVLALECILDGMEIVSSRRDHLDTSDRSRPALLIHFECPLNRPPQPRRNRGSYLLSENNTNKPAKRGVLPTNRVIRIPGKKKSVFSFPIFSACHRDVRELTQRGNTSFGKSCVKRPFYAGISFFDFEQQIAE